MLDLIQTGFDGVNYIYQYFPEGDMSAPGEVTVNTDTLEVTFLSFSPNDRFKKYAGHVWSRLNSYLKDGTFLEEDMVAWG